jgi:hypothetical protein
MHFYRSLIPVAAVLLLSGCTGIVDPSKNEVEVFTGTIPRGGQGPQHTFVVDHNGEYRLDLDSLTPPTGSLVGVSFGQQIEGSCALFTQGAARLGQPALTGPITEGTYCFSLFDPGTLTRDEDYSVTVRHP